MPQFWYHDLSQNQESDVQPTGPPRVPSVHQFLTSGCPQVADMNVKMGIIRWSKKWRLNYSPNLLQKTKWSTTNVPLTYMSEITLVSLSHNSHGLFSISRVFYDSGLLKMRPTFQGSHFCFCHLNEEDPKNQETENKTKQKTRQVSFVGCLFLNSRQKVCQSICTKIAGLLRRLAPGGVSTCAFSVISILRGCLLSAGAIILL